MIIYLLIAIGALAVIAVCKSHEMMNLGTILHAALALLLRVVM